MVNEFRISNEETLNAELFEILHSKFEIQIAGAFKIQNSTLNIQH